MDHEALDCPFEFTPVNSPPLGDPPDVRKYLDELRDKIEAELRKPGAPPLFTLYLKSPLPTGRATSSSPEYRAALRLLNYAGRLAGVPFDPTPGVLSDLVEIMQQEMPAATSYAQASEPQEPPPVRAPDPVVEALERLYHVSGGVAEGNPTKIENIEPARKAARDLLDARQIEHVESAKAD